MTPEIRDLALELEVERMDSWRVERGPSPLAAAEVEGLDCMIISQIRNILHSILVIKP